MSSLQALALALAIVAGIATYLFASDVWGLGVHLWAAFLSWGVFFHSGGKEESLITTITCTLYGVIFGVVCILLNANVDLGLPAPVWISIIVAVAAFLIVQTSTIHLLSVVPAVFYGFAGVAALVFLKAGTDDLLTPSLANPAVSIGLSLVLGALFGYVTEKFAGILSSE